MVIGVNKEAEEFSGWFYINGARATAHHNFETPLCDVRLAPEYKKKSNGQSGYVLAKAKAGKLVNSGQYQRLTDVFLAGETELVATGFNLESGGKVPHAIRKRVDVWLRAASKSEERALVALSEPTDAEQARIAKILG